MQRSNLLGWHVCRVNFARKMFFELRIVLRKMLRNFPRNFWAFVLWVRKKSRKIPSKFPTKFSKFPCEKSKIFTDELLQERRENNLNVNTSHLLGAPSKEGWGWARPIHSAHMRAPHPQQHKHHTRITSNRTYPSPLVSQTLSPFVHTHAFSLCYGCYGRPVAQQSATRRREILTAFGL